VLSGDVTLDVDASVSSLRIPAGSSLTFDPNSARTLTSSGNVVVEGKLRMVSPDPAKIHMLKFKNFDESKFVGGGMDPIPTDVGLWVMGNGVWEGCGSPKIGWGRSTAGLNAGANTLTLDRDPTGWRVGDELAIAPTRKMPDGWDYSFGNGVGTLAGNNEWDYRTITAIDGRTIVLSSGLQYSHPSCDVGDGIIMTPEILNLTRNVRVEGAPGHEAHIFIRSMMPQGDMDDGLCHVAIRYMGPNEFPQQNHWERQHVLGRYALHFHHCFSSETRFLTADGIRTLGDCVGTVQRVLTSNGWSDAEIRSFGEQPLLRVTLKRGLARRVIYATSEHRWFELPAATRLRRFTERNGSVPIRHRCGCRLWGWNSRWRRLCGSALGIESGAPAVLWRLPRRSHQDTRWCRGAAGP
jgi:hypothetical protein